MIRQVNLAEFHTIFVTLKEMEHKSLFLKLELDITTPLKRIKNIKMEKIIHLQWRNLKDITLVL